MLIPLRLKKRIVQLHYVQFFYEGERFLITHFYTNTSCILYDVEFKKKCEFLNTPILPK